MEAPAIVAVACGSAPGSLSSAFHPRTDSDRPAMARRMPSQGQANNPIIVDAATADPMVSSSLVTSTALYQADGVAPQRRYCFSLHHGGFSKGEHPTETSSTAYSSHAARLNVRSVDADGIASQRSGCFDLRRPCRFFKGEHRTKISASPTSRHVSRSVVIGTDHADHATSQRGGCFGLQHRGDFYKAEHPAEYSSSQTTCHAAGFDIRPVRMDTDHAASQRGGCFFKPEHLIENSSSHTSCDAACFDIHPIMMDKADGVASQNSGFFKRQFPANNSSSPTSSHPARFDTCPVVLGRVDRVASPQGSGICGLFIGLLHCCNLFFRGLLRMSSCDVSGIRRFSAGVLMILLIASFAGIATGRSLYASPVCRQRDFGSLMLHDHICYAEQREGFTNAIENVDPVPPTPSISRQVNLGCRYTADVLMILACLAPWYSILKFQQTQGVYIQVFCWRTGHLQIWKYMSISSILYYMTSMLNGLAFSDLAEQLNIFLTNGICGCLFVILLVILMSRHKLFYQVTSGEVAAVGAGCIAALVFTIPLSLACAQLFSLNPAIQRRIFGILAMALMIIMHTLRWFVVNLSWWFLFFNLSGIVSGFLWFCNREGDTIYSWVIVGGVAARTFELAISVVWKLRGESPLIGRTRIVEYGIPLSDRTRYMMDRMRQL